MQNAGFSFGMHANALLIAALFGELHIMLLHSLAYLSNPQQIPFGEFPHIQPGFTRNSKEMTLAARRPPLFVSLVRNHQQSLSTENEQRTVWKPNNKCVAAPAIHLSIYPRICPSIDTSTDVLSAFQVCHLVGQEQKCCLLAENFSFSNLCCVRISVSASFACL